MALKYMLLCARVEVCGAEVMVEGGGAVDEEPEVGVGVGVVEVVGGKGRGAMAGPYWAEPKM